ncbi:hypothetical protein GCM10007902_08820 [Dyella nitratireducens]|nr:hypothetical protein GCM10007902_08820 [Dyella nitratireducens]
MFAGAGRGRQQSAAQASIRLAKVEGAVMARDPGDPGVAGVSGPKASLHQLHPNRMVDPEILA